MNDNQPEPRRYNTGNRLIDQFYIQPEDHVKPRKERSDKKQALFVLTPKGRDVTDDYGDGDEVKS